MRVSCTISLLLAGAALIVDSQAQAQDAAGSPVAAAHDTAPPAQGDIVVTANKREQNLNSVGLTITAIGGEALRDQKITSLADVAQAVPGLVYSPSTANTPIFTLRGIGFNEAALGVYPAVSVYQDQAPLPFPVLASHAAYDLERIEVLKGPQGTLFGQNSTGGAINYIAAKPTDSFSGGGDVSFSRFNTLEINSFVSGPLADGLKARLAINTLRSDDWQRNPFRDDTLGKQRYTAARLLLDWQAAPGLRFNLNVNGWIDKSDPQAQQYAVLQPQPPVTPQVLRDYPFVPTGDPRLADWTDGKWRPRADRRFYQIALRSDLNVTDAITLTSLTSFDHFTQVQATDGDGLSLSRYDLSPNDGRIRSFNQELRIGNGGGAPFIWVIGGNYERSQVIENQILYYPVSAVSNPANNNIYESGIYTRSRMRNIAAFANGELKLAEGLTAKAGLRYTKSTIDAHICGYDAGDGRVNTLFTIIGNALSGQVIPPLGPGSCYSVNQNFVPGAPFEDRLQQDNVSWRVGLDYEAHPGLLFYGNVSRGFKAGSFPTVAAATFGQLAPVTQEKVTTYEAGFKASIADRLAQLNAAVFYYDYRDKQVRGKLVDPIFNLLDVLVNVPRSRVTGGEVELTLRPAQGLSISGAATYLDSKVTSYTGYNVLGGLENFDGVALPFTPKLTYTVNADWKLAGMTSGGTPFIGATLFGKSSQDAVFDGARLNLSGVSGSRVVDGIVNPFHIPGYATLDLRAGYESEAGWRVMLWGKNVFNKYYIVNVIPGSNTSSRFTGRPATYGITIGYRM